MTDPAKTPRRRRPSPSIVALTSLAAFFAVLALLAFQLRAGHDPALSRSTTVARAQLNPQRVIVRRVEDDYVITKVVPAPRATGVSTSASGGGVTQSAPQIVSSSPAPASAPAAAPAPVTHTS